MPVRTFADVDQSTPAFQRALHDVSKWLARALEAEGLSARRRFGGSIAADHPWALGDPENGHLVDPPDPRDPAVAARLRAAGVDIDENGYPVYPHGDTGVQFGRGANNPWGPIQAGDAHVARVGPESGQLEILVGRRDDNGRYATPGGHYDHENVGDTIRRELREETEVDIDFSDAPISYQGDALSGGRTNQAWVVTECRRVHLNPEQAAAVQPKAGDDLVEGSAQFRVITPEMLDDMHDLHGQQIVFTIQDLLAEQPELINTLHPDLAA